MKPVFICVIENNNNLSNVEFGMQRFYDISYRFCIVNMRSFDTVTVLNREINSGKFNVL
jgi:hypothetical protein